jgi:2-C-methyl-D-erythritol 4-phosphate cytidylyltransferase
LITEDLIRASLRAAHRRGAAVAATQARDTVKLSATGQAVRATVPRQTVWLAQTPQVFRKALIEKAYAKLGKTAVTDDAQVAERCGIPVAIVPGSYSNIKITEPRDLEIAKVLLKERKP